MNYVDRMKTQMLVHDWAQYAERLARVEHWSRDREHVQYMDRTYNLDGTRRLRC